MLSAEEMRFKKVRSFWFYVGYVFGVLGVSLSKWKFLLGYVGKMIQMGKDLYSDPGYEIRGFV